VLFAEMTDSNIAIISIVSSLLGGGVTWLVTFLNGRHERSRKEHKEDEKTITDHLEEVRRRCEEENKELKADLKYTNKRLLDVMRHLMYLEGVLETKGIKFRRLEIDDETSVTLAGINERNSLDAPKSGKIKRPEDEQIK
jgi:hypothetical protein